MLMKKLISLLFAYILGFGVCYSSTNDDDFVSYAINVYETEVNGPMGIDEGHTDGDRHFTLQVTCTNNYIEITASKDLHDVLIVIKSASGTPLVIERANLTPSMTIPWSQEANSNKYSIDLIINGIKNN